MATHGLKTWPEFFEAVDSGRKTFEVRKNDRGFKTGDTLILGEFEPKAQVYTGRTLEVFVTGLWNLPGAPGFVGMQIERPSRRGE